jgi:hypothetical protein
MRAQCVQHGPVVAVARRKIEHELGRDPKPGHARVVDGAAERVAPGRAGQGGARLVEHPRQPGVAFELRVEPAWRLRGQVLGRRQAAHRCTGGPISGWSRSRNQVPSAWRRATCARTPAPSRAIVDVRAMSPLTSVGSGSSGRQANGLGGSV